ncbi:MAG: hypothetical protein HY702_06210 [Gemmatimonadetes bacterium]|nr:hypothetical protein [Gemmatimonadota bacterium]
MRRAILTEYLLSATHPEGRPKAGFFRRVGFGPENADALANALLQLARSEEVAEVAEAVDSPHSTKYTGNGVVETPTGIHVSLRTVWIVDSGRQTPRFVTAYPA